MLLCFYLGTVAYLCFAKPDDVPKLPELWFGLPADKVGHFLMFVPFPLLSYLVFSNDEMSTGKKLMLSAILAACGSGLAVGIELLQASLTYRSAETDDLLADGTGLATGAIAVFIYIMRRRNQ